MNLQPILERIKNYSLIIVSVFAAVMSLLYLRKRNEAAEEKAKQVAAEKRGEANELAKQTEEAERTASDSRAEYERLAERHRE